MQDGASNVLDDFRQGAAETFDDAFETLFRIHQRSVYGWLLRIVRNPSAAEDLTVETFWRIYRAHARFDPSRGFEGWARTIATHAALDWLRTQRPEKRTDLSTSPAPVHNRSWQSPPKFGAKQRWHFLAFHPNCALQPFSRSSKNCRTKKLPRHSVSPSPPSKSASFARLRLLRKDLQQQGITP